MDTRSILKRTFWVLLLLFIVTTIALVLMDAQLKTSASPLGIVSFEFCGFTDSCESMIEAWGTTGREYALLLLGIDYLYLFLYPGVLACALLLLHDSLSRPKQAINHDAILSCSVVALADAIENYGSIQMLLEGSFSPFGLMSSVFASIKFAFFFYILFWLIYVASRRIVERKQTSQKMV